MQDEIYVSTEGVEPALRNDVWRAITGSLFETRLPPGNRKALLEGSVSLIPFGGLLVGTTTFNQQTYHRNQRLVVQTGLDQYLLQLFTAGSLNGHCDGHAISVLAGDICIFDLARVASTVVTPGQTISMILPRGPLDQANRGRSLHGTVLRAGEPMTRVLTDLLMGLPTVAASMTNQETLAVEDAMLRLLAAGAARHELDALPHSLALSQVFKQQALAFIDANLYERTLSPDALVRRFQISRAYLYRMFAADGGVAKVIRDKRLDASYRAILRNTRGAQSITDIAFQLGFSNSSQFARAFRTRFAMTPTEARQESNQPSSMDWAISGLHAHFARHSQQTELRPEPARRESASAVEAECA